MSQLRGPVPILPNKRPAHGQTFENGTFLVWTQTRALSCQRDGIPRWGSQGPAPTENILEQLSLVATQLGRDRAKNPSLVCPPAEGGSDHRWLSGPRWSPEGTALVPACSVGELGQVRVRLPPPGRRGASFSPARTPRSAGSWPAPRDLLQVTASSPPVLVPGDTASGCLPAPTTGAPTLQHHELPLGPRRLIRWEQRGCHPYSRALREVTEHGAVWGPHSETRLGRVWGPPCSKGWAGTLDPVAGGPWPRAGCYVPRSDGVASAACFLSSGHLPRAK